MVVVTGYLPHTFHLVREERRRVLGIVLVSQSIISPTNTSHLYPSAVLSSVLLHGLCCLNYLTNWIGNTIRYDTIEEFNVDSKAEYETA